MLPFLTAAVVAMGFPACRGKSTVRKLSMLKIWMLLLVFLGLVYLVHGYILGKNLQLLTDTISGKQLIEIGAQKIAEKHKVGAAAFTLAAGFGNNIVRHQLEQQFHFPASVLFFFGNRRGLSLMAFGFGPAIAAFAFAMVISGLREEIAEEIKWVREQRTSDEESAREV